MMFYHDHLGHICYRETTVQVVDGKPVELDVYDCDEKITYYVPKGVKKYMRPVVDGEAVLAAFEAIKTKPIKVKDVTDAKIKKAIKTANFTELLEMYKIIKVLETRRELTLMEDMFLSEIKKVVTKEAGKVNIDKLFKEL